MATVSREALYEQVWSRPMIEVAASYGVTGTALKKTCTRHEIPTPERGYWARLQHGKPVRQQPLPKLTDARLARITITGQSGGRSDGVRQAKAKARERLGSTAGDVQAATEPLREPSALAATRRAIEKARPDGQGFAAIQGAGLVPLRIAPASIDRALSILSRLLALAESQGYRPRITDAGLALAIDDETVSFGIEERAQNVPHEPTAAELKQAADHERWGFSGTPWPKYDHVPSARLALTIHENSYGGLRRNYADGKTRTLEDLLPDVIVGCAEHAAMIKERRRADEERARRWKEAEARRARTAAHQAREKRRLEFAEAVHAQLVQRGKLSAVLVHLENVATEAAPGPQAMASWLKRRIQEIDALIGPDFLELSARAAKLDFDEPKASDDASSTPYYSSQVELQFWSIDRDKEEARSVSPLQWAIENGLAAGWDGDGGEK